MYTPLEVCVCVYAFECGCMRDREIETCDETGGTPPFEVCVCVCVCVGA